jgi:hypothetical protein
MLRQYINPPQTVFSLTDRPAGVSNTTSTMGANITTGATPHEATAWVELFSAAQVASEIHILYLSIFDTTVSTAQTDALVDIGIGPSGSETVLISNIPAGWKANGTSFNLPEITIPILIQAGTRIVARARSLQTAKAVRIIAGAQGFRDRPRMTFSGVDCLGGSPSTSRGTSVTPGNTGSFGSWTNIGSATTRAYSGILPLMQGFETGTVTANAYAIEAGINSSKLSGSESWRWNVTAAEITFGPNPSAWHYAQIPISTQLQVRAAATATGQVFDAVILAGYF